MEKIELYRQVFSSFKELCVKGEQSSSFSAYCREHGVSSSQMRQILKEEFQNVRSLPGFAVPEYNAEKYMNPLKLYVSKANNRGPLHRIIRASA